MAITDKPFDSSEQLKKITFKGRPAFFNAIDFNKKNEVTGEALEDLIEFVGVKSTSVITITNISDVTGALIDPGDVGNYNENNGYKSMSGSFGTDYYVRTLSFDYDIAEGQIETRGVKFDLAAKNGSFSYVYAWLEGTPPVPAYITMFSELQTKEFGDGQANSDELCGIQSDEYPTLVPSCQIEQYVTADISIGTEDPNNTTNNICLLGSIMPSESSETITYGLYENAEVYDGILYNTDNGSTAAVLYSNNSIVEQLKSGYLESLIGLSAHLNDLDNPHEVPGLIYKGILDGTVNLDDYASFGVYQITGSSTPSNFPSPTILGITNTADGEITDGSEFILTIYELNNSLVIQELRYRQGVGAKRYKDTSGTWSAWVSAWSTVADALEGVRRCGSISPYTLQKHSDWAVVTYESGFEADGGDNCYYRKTTSNMLQIKGSCYRPSDSSTLAFVLPIGFKPLSTFYGAIHGGNNIIQCTINTNGEVSIIAGGSNTHLDISLTIPLD